MDHVDHKETPTSGRILHPQVGANGSEGKRRMVANLRTGKAFETVGFETEAAAVHHVCVAETGHWGATRIGRFSVSCGDFATMRDDFKALPRPERLRRIRAALGKRPGQR